MTQNTIKIADLPKICNCPEHNPPTGRYYEDGVYQHTCPKCGEKQTFEVNNPKL